MDNGVLLEGSHVGAAGLLGGVIDGFLQGAAGEGCAGNGVHAGAVGSDDVGDHDIEGGRAHMGSFAGDGNRHIGNGGLGEGHRDLHGAVVALGDTGVGTGGEGQLGSLSGFASGSGDGSLSSLAGGIGGQRCAGDAVDFGALGFQDLSRQGLQCGSANGGGFAFAGDGYSGNAGSVGGDFHNHCAAEALFLTGVGAGNKGFLCAGHALGQQE